MAGESDGRATLRDLMGLQSDTFKLVQTLDGKFDTLAARVTTVEVKQDQNNKARDRRAGVVGAVCGAVASSVAAFTFTHALPILAQILPLIRF